MESTTVSRKSAPASIQPFLAELTQQVQAHYGVRLACLLLFGSQARGDAVHGSDVDILVVLHGETEPHDKPFARDLVYALLLRYDLLAMLLHTTLDRYLYEQSPLMINIRREGLVLLPNGKRQHPLQAETTREQPAEPARKDEITAEQIALLHKAQASLYWARQMADGGQYGFAASRVYYAMFYVAQIFLLSQGLSFSKHSAVIAAFGKHIAHPGIGPVAFHRYLIDAQDARLIGDYAPEANLSEAEIGTLFDHATAFVEAVERWGDGDGNHELIP